MEPVYIKVIAEEMMRRMLEVPKEQIPAQRKQESHEEGIPPPPNRPAPVPTEFSPEQLAERKPR